jgi:penicillin-binding protein 1A
VVRDVGKPIAGKTGTTNDEKDVWFIGYSPDIVCGVYMGYDKPRHIGRLATGGHVAAPIVRDFLKVALADKPPIPFRVPPGIKLIRVDANIGMRAYRATRARSSTFKPGCAPRQLLGSGRNCERRAGAGLADAERAVRTGTGGLHRLPARRLHRCFPLLKLTLNLTLKR